MRLSLDYFESLQRHAVPLDERALVALSHTAMGLDLYAGWRSACTASIRASLPSSRGPLLGTSSAGTMADRKFKEVFRQTLDIVLSQYRGARLELDDWGMTLRSSPPPVKGRLALISEA